VGLLASDLAAWIGALAAALSAVFAGLAFWAYYKTKQITETG